MTSGDELDRTEVAGVHRARRLQWRYLTALGLVALVVLLGQILVELALARLAVDVPLLGRALAGGVVLALLALAGGWLFLLRPATLRNAQQLKEALARVEQEAARRARAEAQSRETLALASHAARTSTLGDMASALAHELNQPLGAIANYAEGCLVELQKEPPDLAEVRSALEHLRAAALRAGEVTKRIRRLVRRQPAQCAPFDPNQAVAEVAELLRHEAVKRKIALEIDLAPDLPYVSGDVVQVQQVLINLVRNGWDAIDAADASESSRRTVVMQTRGFGPQAVELAVTDSGEGIPSDRLDRIFDAYFSTRVEGMGMGLAISRAIVEAHQGTLTVLSEPGVATTFRFTLPCAGMEHDAGPNRLCR